MPGRQLGAFLQTHEGNLKSKTTEDIISNRSFMEVLVLNHYVLVKKVLPLLPCFHTNLFIIFVIFYFIHRLPPLGIVARNEVAVENCCHHIYLSGPVTAILVAGIRFCSSVSEVCDHQEVLLGQRKVHVTWAKNGNGRRLSTSSSGDMDVSFIATKLSVRFK
nr:hypothetical protein [Tanacetum cinerariifolium]